MKQEHWSRFWMEEKDAFHDIMKLSTSVFAQRLDDYFHFNKSQHVLDYGCGPGFLVDYMAKRGVQLSGVDINQYYLNQCIENHPDGNFFSITTSVQNNKKIFSDRLGDQKFDYIIVLSIVQYFDNDDELNEVIKMLKTYLTPGGKIVIADVISSNTSSVMDGLALLYHCIFSGRILEFIKFMRYLFTSSYSVYSNQIKLKQFSEHVINEIASRCEMTSTKARGLTIHPTRDTYIFQ